MGQCRFGLQSAGVHKVPWCLKLDGKRLTAGVYDVLLEVRLGGHAALLQ
jgi:hypothetical protein